MQTVLIGGVPKILCRVPLVRHSCPKEFEKEEKPLFICSQPTLLRWGFHDVIRMYSFNVLLISKSPRIYTLDQGTRPFLQLGHRQKQRTVADAVEVAISVIARLWSRFQETGLVRHQPWQGRQCASTANFDRCNLLTVLRDRTANLDGDSQKISLATGRRIVTGLSSRFQLTVLLDSLGQNGNSF
ncbi:hypothetical protein TNCV_4845861 [Trichonephila clavipes]|uniref:Uncharacterized protein n=1 Tax=Trichonephila clavipes TaxID=2585209 RepID=A0A8X7BN38_TRICX|nr:hypothetical protein TNCV_4845861 [Trichonephila clavipes]